MNQFLIPANSKKSMLYFSMFTTADLILFGCGLAISFILLMTLPVQQFWMAILAIFPGMICGFLVLPVQNYHNVRSVIANAWKFYTTRQKYIWKGWCFGDGERSKK